MSNRTKELVGMAQDAGLHVLQQCQKEQRVCIQVKAENGNTMEFCVPHRSTDARSDQNARASLKRWARANSNPLATTTTKHPDNVKTSTAIKPAAPATTAAEEALTHAEFYSLSIWLPTALTLDVPSLGVLAVHASKHIGRTVSEDAMRGVMTITKTAEPEHWKPIEPHVVVARELESLMKRLGETASPAFQRLMEKLA